MDVASPIRSVLPSLEGPVLEVLAGTTGSLAGREVARLTRGGSEAGVRRALHRLVEQGVVRAEARGGAVLYALNRRHLAYPAVEVLVALRRTLLSRLRGAIETWAQPPVHVSLFGSAARRDGDAASDIDVLLVRPADLNAAERDTWTEQLDQLRVDVEQWTGNRCQLYEIDPDELAEHVRKRTRIVREWLADAVTLHGSDLTSLARAVTADRRVGKKPAARRVARTRKEAAR